MAEGKLELIPGLPEEVGRMCLIRLPLNALRTAQCVCRHWKRDIASPTFHRLRKAAGFAKPVVALLQTDPPKVSFPPPHIYHMVLFEPVTGVWTTPPMIPRPLYAFPDRCEIASVGKEVVVFGGWDSRACTSSDEVDVYDLVSGPWRRGARMPGPRRSSFASAAAEVEGRRMVFVAGGCDNRMNVLRSALAYDVTADLWVQLPDMTQPRFECKGFFAGGAFRVLGGYPTEAQTQFLRTAEAFNVAAWRWFAEREPALEEAAAILHMCVAVEKEKVYMFREGRVVEMLEDGSGGGWRTVAELPREVRTTPLMVAWEGGLMVPVRAAIRPLEAYVLDTGTKTWRELAVPSEYSGKVQACCSLLV